MHVDRCTCPRRLDGQRKGWDEDCPSHKVASRIEKVEPPTFHTDPETGARKETKLERHDLIPVRALRALAEHYGRGALKYGDHNWAGGYDWSLSYAALQRHLMAWWGGEDTDPETGSSHLTAAAWHCFALLEFTHTHPEKDNRRHG